MRESIYKRYNPDVKHGYEKCPAYWFIFNIDKLLINPEKDIKIPFIEDLNVLDVSIVREHYSAHLMVIHAYVLKYHQNSFT